MASNEEIISSIEEEFKNRNEDYETLARLEKDKQQQKKQSILTFLVVYSIVAVTFASVFLFKGNNDLTSFPFIISREDGPNNKELQNQIDLIKKQFAQITASTSSNVQDTQLAKRVNDLESRVRSIELTIQTEPNEVVNTAVLIEKQKNSDSEISDLKTAIGHLNDRIYDLVLVMLAVPIITILLGWAFSYLQKKVFKWS